MYIFLTAGFKNCETSQTESKLSQSRLVLWVPIHFICLGKDLTWLHFRKLKLVLMRKSRKGL